ncbi:hypothetical protein ACP4OV_018587 [Aristida adscensionis]
MDGYSGIAVLIALIRSQTTAGAPPHGFQGCGARVVRGRGGGCGAVPTRIGSQEGARGGWLKAASGGGGDLEEHEERLRAVATTCCKCRRAPGYSDDTIGAVEEDRDVGAGAREGPSIHLHRRRSRSPAGFSQFGRR